MSNTNMVLGSWRRGEWPEYITVSHEGMREPGRRYVPERTCRPEVCDDGAGAWGAHCSECGYRFAGPYGKREVPEHMATRRDIMPRYCSSCGSRVEVD